MAVDTQRTAELQVLLEGVALPASRQELLDYAGQQPGGQEFLADLRTLPDREYARLDEVGEELFPVQPSSSAEPPPAKPESDKPPGGDEYTQPNPEPGAVRYDAPPDNPPQKAIEKQTQAQNKQKQRRESGG